MQTTIKKKVNKNFTVKDKLSFFTVKDKLSFQFNFAYV